MSMDLKYIVHIGCPVEFVCKAFAYYRDGKFPSMIEMTLEPVESGTRMVFKFQLRVNRLISAAMRGVIREQLFLDLARLASQLEAEG